jgi:hypothetical protein
MIATQSHGFLFEDFPATRVAWPGHLDDLAKNAGGPIAVPRTTVVCLGGPSGGFSPSAALRGAADTSRKKPSKAAVIRMGRGM